jgi:hypothetical protein
MISLDEYFDRHINIDGGVPADRITDCNSCNKVKPCPSKKSPKGWKKRLPPEYISATLCTKWQPKF